MFAQSLAQRFAFLLRRKLIGGFKMVRGDLVQLALRRLHIARGGHPRAFEQAVGRPAHR
jgi:hypothetical protein